MRNAPPAALNNILVRVLAFRHGPHEHLGWICDALDAHGIAYDYTDSYQIADERRLRNAGALIFLGGTMSVNDDLPFIHREVDHIRAAVIRGQPVLGICLGAQLIAKALGARVYKNTVTEIGWAPVTFTSAAPHDPLFAHLPRSETVFHWHGDTFDLPDGAELLASSAHCRHQAFRLGDRVYGLQFHLEVTPAMIVQWCAEDAACGDAREVKKPIDSGADAEQSGKLARLVFNRWCSLVKEHAACGASR
ncbi:MAG: glutamine amidotransferase class-I [Bryobacterales bacterium]|nr:glutamine amidotransferase class-I [Bryobacterales bacterium]